LLIVKLVKSNNSYSDKTASSRQNEKEMVILAWTVKELTELGEVGRQLFSEIKEFERQNPEGRYRNRRKCS